MLVLSLAALSGAALFALLVVLSRRPALGPSPGARNRSWAWERLRARLLPEEERRMARVLGWPERRLWVVVVVGSAMAAMFAAGKQPVLAALAAFLGVWCPRVVLRREYRRWRAMVLGQLPQLADVLQALFDAGLTVPTALREAALLVDQPMRREVERLSGAIVSGPDEFTRALGDFGVRTMSAEAGAFAQRLVVAWDVRAPGEEVFAGLGRTLARLREAEYARRSKTMPVKIIGAAILGLLNVSVAVGVPLWIYSMSQISKP